MKTKQKGFTLVELLVVMTLIAVLSGAAIFALQGSRASARDAKRKGDLETIRTGLEIYKSDCGIYPPQLPAVGSSLSGNGTGTCLSTNKYIEVVPGDPSSGSSYCYNRDDTTNVNYELCANLENNPTTLNPCSACDSGSGAAQTDYKVRNP